MSISQSSYIPAVSDDNDTSDPIAALTNTRINKVDGRDRVEFICKLEIKRKTLFYTVNLIIPTVNS
jgi:hypothetical protein